MERMVRSPWPWVTPPRPSRGPWAQGWAWSLSPGRAQCLAGCRPQPPQLQRSPGHGRAVPPSPPSPGACIWAASCGPRCSRFGGGEAPSPAPVPFWWVREDRSPHWCLSRVVRSRALTARATPGASGDSPSPGETVTWDGRAARAASTPDPVEPPICSIPENSQGHTEKHRTHRREAAGRLARGEGDNGCDDDSTAPGRTLCPAEPRSAPCR